MRMLVKIISLITIVLASLLIIGHIVSNFPQETSDLNLVFLIIGIGTISSILAEIRIKRSVKVILLVTSVLAFSGVFVFAVTHEISDLKFAIIILGIGIGILSTLVEKRSKSLFYGSVVIILLGWGLIAVYQGYMHPSQIDMRYTVTDLESFYAVFMGYFFNNTFVAFISVLGGPIVIYPYLQLSYNIAGDFPEFIASIVAFHGYKGIILALGWFNAYPELLAFFLAVMAGIRVALKSFQAVINIRRDGVFNAIRKIRDALVSEIVNTMPKVVALLLIAAVLETLWTQFWVNYWLQNIL